jgi:hypothetical protein
MNIMHRDGVAMLQISDLPEDLRQKLGYNEKSAAAAQDEFSEKQQHLIAQKQQQDKDRKLAKEIEKLGINVDRATIFQVVPDGVLIDSAIAQDGEEIIQDTVRHVNALGSVTTTTVPRRVKTSVSKRLSPGDRAFVRTGQQGLVDGGTYSGKIYPTGQFTYGTAIGGSATVAAFSDIPEVVAKHYGLE